MPTILLPRQLLSLTELPTSRVAISGVGTVQHVLTSLTDLHPMIKTTVFNAAGTLQTFVNVFVDGEHIEDLQAQVAAHSEIQIVVAVAGG